MIEVTGGAATSPGRYEISDFERLIIEPLLPNKSRGA